MAKLPPRLRVASGLSLRRSWAQTQRGSASERGYGSDWRKVRARIMDRDRRLCQPCRRAGVSAVAHEVDHILAKHLGGKDEDTNLQAICRTCHRTKTAREGRSQQRSAKNGGRGGGGPISGRPRP